MAGDAARHPYRQETPRIALVVLGFAVVAAVFVVPLLMDLGNLRNTYYFPKARALYILTPLILLMLVLVRQIRRLVVDPGILIPAGLFMAIAGISTGLGVNPSWSLLGAPWRSEGLLTLLAYPMVLVGTLAFIRMGYLRVWLAAALTGATVVALYGVAQYLGYEWLVRDGLRLRWWQAFSTTGNPNSLGAYMVLMLPFALVAASTARRRATTVLSAAAVLMLYLAALFSHSRSAWASMGVVLVLLVMLFPRVSQVEFRRSLVAVSVLAVITVIFLVPHGPMDPRPVWETSPKARIPSALQRAGSWTVESPAGQIRPYLWRQAIPLILRRSVLGYGPEALSLVFPQTWDEEKIRLFGPYPKRIDKAHNDTLDMALSVGVLGLAVYWWLLAAALRRGWAAFRQPRDNRLIGLACAIGIVAFWLDLQFSFSVVSVAPVFWSVLGVAAGLGAGPLVGQEELG